MYISLLSVLLKHACNFFFQKLMYPVILRTYDVVSCRGTDFVPCIRLLTKSGIIYMKSINRFTARVPYSVQINLSELLVPLY